MNYVHSSRRRLDEARRIAEEVRHDERLHQLAMKAVFVLEDCHESFVRLQREKERRTAPMWPSDEFTS